MYNFNGDEKLQKQFFESLENSNIQHIKGTIKRLDGVIIDLNEKNLLDGIRYDSQCTEDENVFNFGEMYIGSAEVKVSLPDENINLIKGGELSLYFTVENMEKELIPLGVWDIVTAERESGNIFIIKGYDHLNRLNTPVTDDSIGAIFMKSVLRQVSKDAGVEFAQSIEEIQQIAGDSIDIIEGSWATHFLDTCWNEVRAIAQFLGCFAVANREGKIEFRRFASYPLMEIPAEKRFSARISDYQYSIKGISYTDNYGNTVTYTENNSNGCTLGFSDNKYIWETEDNPEAEYSDDLKRIANAVGCYSNDLLQRRWSPGIVEYYGNPALDVGDMVELSGGVNGNNATNFLITHISWQFRGTQTLVSGGMPESGTAFSSGSSGTSGIVTSYTTINTTSNISVVELKTYAGEIFETERFVAKAGFSSIRETWIFADCTLILSGDGLVSASVWLNGVAQTLRPKITLHDGEISTLHFSFTTKISGGRHNIQIGVRGNAAITDIQAFLWGQDITAETPEFTDDSDYIYTKNNGLTTITGYVGKSIFPSIPDDLGSGQTSIIERNSFSESKIENVYISDGVTEIR